MSVHRVRAGGFRLARRVAGEATEQAVEARDTAVARAAQHASRLIQVHAHACWTAGLADLAQIHTSGRAIECRRIEAAVRATVLRPLSVGARDRGHAPGARCAAIGCRHAATNCRRTWAGTSHGRAPLGGRCHALLPSVLAPMRFASAANACRQRQCPSQLHKPLSHDCYVTRHRVRQAPRSAAARTTNARVSPPSSPSSVDCARSARRAVGLVRRLACRSARAH
jgi:hypothetical protein